MKNKITNSIIISILLVLTMVTAIEVYQTNTPINLNFICTLNGAIPSSITKYNITIVDPVGNIVINNNETTPQGNGAFNFTFTFLQIGDYQINQFCYDGVYSYANSEKVEIRALGGVQQNGITQSSIYLLIALIISMLIYIRISKFFGSMMIFILGFGMLFTEVNNGWIGWIVIASGFIMLLYSLIMDKSNKRRR